MPNQRTEVAHKPPGYGIHKLDTCRIGEDSRRSVFDKSHQSHAPKTLFVVDGGSFVSSDWQNPP
jgi:choline dehydrogenase-like flavoprotein